jgi:hypothetical protein
VWLQRRERRERRGKAMTDHGEREWRVGRGGKEREGVLE